MQLNEFDFFIDKVGKEVSRYKKINAFLISLCIILILIMIGTIPVAFVDLDNLPDDNGQKQIFIDVDYDNHVSFGDIDTYSIVVLNEVDFTMVFMVI